MHGDGQGDAIGPGDTGGVPLLDGEVERLDGVARPPQRRRRRGDVQRLVAQLVGRDQEDVHGAITTSRLRAASRRAASTAAGVSARAKTNAR